MFDMQYFGEKLKYQRKKLNLTQEEVAQKVGVSPQAVSKWESGECLPDAINLKSIAELYNVSLDILLETEKQNDIFSVSEKIEQIADDFIWSKQKADIPNLRRELGDDLWQMWKGIFFIEVGNKEYQKKDKADGNLRVTSEYGMKVWDDEGVCCVVKNSLRNKLSTVGQRELHLLSEMTTKEGIKLLSLLDTTTTKTKEELITESGIETSRLNELLLKFTENRIIEYEITHAKKAGYKICGHFGIAAYMVLAAAFILSKKQFKLLEYFEN